MQYYATITNENGDQLLRVALLNLKCEQRSPRSVRLTGHLRPDLMVQPQDEPEMVTMDGVIIARLAGTEIPRVIQEERQIYVPE